MSPLKPEEIVAFTREANQSLGGYLADLPDEEIPAEWLQQWSLALARDLYRRQPHWHTVNNDCVAVTPFEVQMQALALFTSWWVADIFLRKARDRNAPRMVEAEMKWEGLLLRGITAIQREISERRDPEAEEAYQQTPGGRGQRGFRWKLRHTWNVWKWGH